MPYASTALPNVFLVLYSQPPVWNVLWKPVADWHHLAHAVGGWLLSGHANTVCPCHGQQTAPLLQRYNVVIQQHIPLEWTQWGWLSWMDCIVDVADSHFISEKNFLWLESSVKTGILFKLGNFNSLYFNYFLCNNDVKIKMPNYWVIHSDVSEPLSTLRKSTFNTKTDQIVGIFTHL